MIKGYMVYLGLYVYWPCTHLDRAANNSIKLSHLVYTFKQSEKKK
jgi:hypothetical protein